VSRSDDIEQYAEMAMKGAIEANDRSLRNERAIDMLDKRVEALEYPERPSQIDARQNDILAELERRLASKSSRPPDSTAEVRAADGRRVRAPAWAVIVAMALALAIAAVWRAKDLADIVSAMRK
jgi:hypothetical protein